MHCNYFQGDCLLPNLLGKFYDQQQHCDVTFQLQDGSTVQAKINLSSFPFLFLKKQAHKLFLAVASPVFEGMFFGPLADKGLREVMRLQMSTFFLALHCIALMACDNHSVLQICIKYPWYEV